MVRVKVLKAKTRNLLHVKMSVVYCTYYFFCLTYRKTKLMSLITLMNWIINIEYPNLTANQWILDNLTFLSYPFQRNNVHYCEKLNIFYFDIAIFSVVINTFTIRYLSRFSFTGKKFEYYMTCLHVVLFCQTL